MYLGITSVGTLRVAFWVRALTTAIPPHTVWAPPGGAGQRHLVSPLHTMHTAPSVWAQTYPLPHPGEVDLVSGDVRRWKSDWSQKTRNGCIVCTASHTVCHWNSLRADSYSFTQGKLTRHCKQTHTVLLSPTRWQCQLTGTMCSHGYHFNNFSKICICIDLLKWKHMVPVTGPPRLPGQCEMGGLELQIPCSHDSLGTDYTPTELRQASCTCECRYIYVMSENTSRWHLVASCWGKPY